MKSVENNTAFLLIIFENRKRWNRGIVNKNVTIFPRQSEMAGRAGIDKIVVKDLDGLWTFISE